MCPSPSPLPAGVTSHGLVEDIFAQALGRPGASGDSPEARCIQSILGVARRLSTLSTIDRDGALGQQIMRGMLQETWPGLYQLYPSLRDKSCRDQQVREPAAAMPIRALAEWLWLCAAAAWPAAAWAAVCHARSMA